MAEREHKNYLVGLPGRLTKLIDSRFTGMAEASRELKIPLRNLENWTREFRPTTPRADGLARLSRGLDVSADYILFGESSGDEAGESPDLVDAAPWTDETRLIGAIVKAIGDLWRAITPTQRYESAHSFFDWYAAERRRWGLSPPIAKADGGKTSTAARANSKGSD